MVEDALIHGAELLVTASYYGSVVLSKLSSASNLWAEVVRTQLSTQLLSPTAALPSSLFIASPVQANCAVTSSPSSWATVGITLKALHRHLGCMIKVTCSEHSGRTYPISTSSLVITSSLALIRK